MGVDNSVLVACWWQWVWLRERASIRGGCQPGVVGEEFGESEGGAGERTRQRRRRRRRRPPGRRGEDHRRGHRRPLADRCPVHGGHARPDLGAVFTGDTLFAGRGGRATGRSYSDFPITFRSIRDRLLTLPPETVGHTGHGEPYLKERVDRGY